jgi:hypothetical protein
MDSECQLLPHNLPFIGQWGMTPIGRLFPIRNPVIEGFSVLGNVCFLIVVELGYPVFSSFVNAHLLSP